MVQEYSLSPVYLYKSQALMGSSHLLLDGGRQRSQELWADLGDPGAAQHGGGGGRQAGGDGGPGGGPDAQLVLEHLAPNVLGEGRQKRGVHTLRQIDAWETTRIVRALRNQGN